MPNVLKSGILNLLERSGPVQACNGTALLYTFNYAVILGLRKCRAVSETRGICDVYVLKQKGCWKLRMLSQSAFNYYVM